MPDVVVFGGGPVGSHTASRLAKAGHQVLVLEKKPELGEPVCCTGIISQVCADIYGINDGVILRRVNSARLLSPSGKMLRVWRPETQACVVDRPAFDRVMAKRAQLAGAEYLPGTTVKDIEVKKDGVSVMASRNGKNHCFDCRAVVDASGFGSRLGERMGLSKVSDFVMGAQAEVMTNGIDEVEVYFARKIAPGFFAWLVPTSSRTALVGLMSRRNSGAYFKEVMSLLRAQGKITATEARISFRGIPLRSLAKTYGRRFLVVGSAAGQVKPLTGGGIYYGLLCADIAADTLHRALVEDNLSARNLASYEREWQKKIGRELSLSYWARKLFERLNDRQLDRIFEIVRSRGIAESFLKNSEVSFDWHGQVVMKLVKEKALSGILELVRLPFVS